MRFQLTINFYIYILLTLYLYIFALARLALSYHQIFTSFTQFSDITFSFPTKNTERTFVEADTPVIFFFLSPARQYFQGLIEFLPEKKRTRENV